MESKIELPGIIFDIDGVILRGEMQIPNAEKVIKFLTRPLSQIFPDKYPNVH